MSTAPLVVARRWRSTPDALYLRLVREAVPRPRSRRPEVLRLGVDWARSPGDLLGGPRPAEWFSALVARWFADDQPEDLAAWLEKVHGVDDRTFGMWPTRHGWVVHTDLGERTLTDAGRARVTTAVEES